MSPPFGEISKGLVERVGSLPLAFHAFHSPGISTARSSRGGDETRRLPQEARAAGDYLLWAGVLFLLAGF